MLNQLTESLQILPDLLVKREAWDSLIVNRRKPHTYRVFTTLPSGLRCCLHMFDPCHDHEAFQHPHPWPGAFCILRGSYKMQVGFSADRASKPSEVLTLVLPRYSQYEITNPLTWHSVIPLEPTWTIMVNGEPWDRDHAHQEVRTTKGKDLDKMPEDELIEHLALFSDLLDEFLKR